MRVACVLVTHLRAKVEMSRQPHLKTTPVLIVHRDASRARPLVVDRFPGASEVVAGMTLEQAGLTARERRRAGRRRAALPPGLRPCAQGPSGGQRPGRDGGTRHGLCTHRRAGAPAPGRGPGRLGPAERCSRVSQAAPGRCRLEVPGLCGRQDEPDSWGVQGAGGRGGLPCATSDRPPPHPTPNEDRDAPAWV